MDLATDNAVRDGYSIKWSDVLARLPRRHSFHVVTTRSQLACTIEELQDANIAYERLKLWERLGMIEVDRVCGAMRWTVKITTQGRDIARACA